MPGGVGKVSNTVVTAGNRSDRKIVRTRNANQIFYNLDSRHVYYDAESCLLYFVDSDQGQVARTIRATLDGIKGHSGIEQVYLDPHKYFNGARRVQLTSAQVAPLLVALRLAGIRTTIG
ncbi:MAG: hypothetical protein KDI88_12405 [Gammaproteobacteria bacterium]|nr:hypothetical protein [Gammaproteobacteria bacterium]